MARALECPACGAKRRIANLPDEPTFRCDGCGQILTVPRPAPVAPVAATRGARASASAGGASIAPPPRRRPPGAPPAPAPVAVGAVSATLGPSGGDAPTLSRRDRAAKDRGAKASRRSEPWRRVSWYWRLLAWLVAVPLGFVVTAYPAYHFKLIRKDDVLNVFVGSGTDRYTRLAIGTVVWALVTAVLVQLLIEGGRWWMARRRARRGVALPSTP